jgi:hypothetical protein
VKTTNLRNKPVDRRRLSAEDRAQYQPQNRMKAVAKARARKGQMAWSGKVNIGRQEQNPGTGGFVQGISLQQARLREEGAKVQRAKALRPEKPIY